MSCNYLHVAKGRELWLITTLCFYGISIQVGSHTTVVCVYINAGHTHYLQ